MSKDHKVRLDCRALPYLEPVARPPSPEDAGAALLSSGSRSPVRATIEARSDLSFTHEVVSALAKDLGDEMARSLALAVLASPSVAARKGQRGAEQQILQSVIVSGHQDDFEAQVTVRLLALSGKPGKANLETVEMDYVDLSNATDQCTVVAQVEQWWSEFPMPSFAVPQPLPLRDWAWLGDPSHVGITSVPADWKDQIRRLGAVYGVTPLIVESADQMKSWNVVDRVEHAVVLRGSKPAGQLPTDATDSSLEVTEWGYNGEPFDSVLAQVRAHLLAEAVAANRPVETSRPLEGGEVIYHRKVGNSKKFDRFDAGSLDPCSHGAGSFTGWGGDKALKGMARRYDNFTPAMLIHCERFPNCGMYGVDAARGGVRKKPGEDPTTS